MLPPGMEGAQVDRALGGLPLGETGFRFLDAMISGVADHVNQRIGNLLDDVAIQFRVFTTEDELNLLALLGRQVTHQAGHLLEGGADGHHAQRHGGALKLAGDAAKLAEIAGEVATGGTQQLRVLHDHRLGDDEFADEIDEAVELGGVHFDGATGPCDGVGVGVGGRGFARSGNRSSGGGAAGLRFSQWLPAGL